MRLFRFRRSDVWYSLILVGLSAGIAALVTITAVYDVYQLTSNVLTTLGGGSAIEETSGPNPFPYLLLAAPLAAAVLAPLAWWILVIWRGRLSMLSGAGAGAIVGLLAHPLMWFFWYAIVVIAAPAALSNPFTYGPIDNRFADIPVIAFLGALTVGFYSLASIVLTGWLTVAVGALGGTAIALAQTYFGCRERWRTALARSAWI